MKGGGCSKHADRVLRWTRNQIKPMLRTSVSSTASRMLRCAGSEAADMLVLIRRSVGDVRRCLSLAVAGQPRLCGCTTSQTDSQVVTNHATGLEGTMLGRDTLGSCPRVVKCAKCNSAAESCANWQHEDAKL